MCLNFSRIGPAAESDHCNFQTTGASPFDLTYGVLRLNSAGRLLSLNNLLFQCISHLEHSYGRCQPQQSNRHILVLLCSANNIVLRSLFRPTRSCPTPGVWILEAFSSPTVTRRCGFMCNKIK